MKLVGVSCGQFNNGLDIWSKIDEITFSSKSVLICTDVQIHAQFHNPLLT